MVIAVKPSEGALSLLEQGDCPAKIAGSWTKPAPPARRDKDEPGCLSALVADARIPAYRIPNCLIPNPFIHYTLK